MSDDWRESTDHTYREHMANKEEREQEEREYYDRQSARNEAVRVANEAALQEPITNEIRAAEAERNREFKERLNCRFGNV